MIVSLHLPKTAGSSFRDALLAHFGSRLMLDYAERPLDIPLEQRSQRALEQGLKLDKGDFEGFDCVHGHFLAAKYLPLAERLPLEFVTWLRHPVDRIVSHYHYWRQQPAGTDITALRSQMLAENWSLQEFALCEPMRNLCASFLQPLDLEQFRFVGITEHFGEDLSTFAGTVLGAELIEYRSNPAQKVVRAVDADLRKEIQEFHAADMALYQQALSIRESRRLSGSAR